MERIRTKKIKRTMEIKTRPPFFRKEKKEKKEHQNNSTKAEEKEREGSKQQNRQLNVIITGPFNDMRFLRLKWLCHVILAFFEIPNMP